MIGPAPVLPVKHLSKSSIGLYLKCPEKFRRRYIEHESEPMGVPMLLGATVGAAVGANLQQKIESHQDLAMADVVERFAGEWEERVAVDEIEWQVPQGRAKDQGVLLTQVYQQRVAPSVQPISVERRLQLQLAGAEWTIQGYIDYETVDGVVADLKVKAKRPTPAELATELDPTLYLAARRAEGSPASFEYHTLIKTNQPVAERYPVHRSDRELDRFLQRVSLISHEIVWRVESGNWQGAPLGAWWCSAKACGFWNTCRYGGA